MWSTTYDDELAGSATSDSIISMVAEVSNEIQVANNQDAGDNKHKSHEVRVGENHFSNI